MTIEREKPTEEKVESQNKFLSGIRVPKFFSTFFFEKE